MVKPVKKDTAKGFVQRSWVTVLMLVFKNSLDLFEKLNLKIFCDVHYEFSILCSVDYTYTYTLLKLEQIKYDSKYDSKYYSVYSDFTSKQQDKSKLTISIYWWSELSPSEIIHKFLYTIRPRNT